MKISRFLAIIYCMCERLCAIFSSVHFVTIERALRSRIEMGAAIKFESMICDVSFFSLFFGWLVALYTLRTHYFDRWLKPKMMIMKMNNIVKCMADNTQFTQFNEWTDRSWKWTRDASAYIYLHTLLIRQIGNNNVNNNNNNLWLTSWNKNINFRTECWWMDKICSSCVCVCVVNLQCDRLEFTLRNPFAISPIYKHHIHRDVYNYHSHFLIQCNAVWRINVNNRIKFHRNAFHW